MLKGIIPGPGQLTGKALMAIVTASEGVTMLTIAAFLDAAGFFLFILSILGYGIPLSWLFTLGGTMTIGSWLATRSMFRGVIERAAQNISKKTLNIGDDQEGSGNTTSPVVESGKKVAKTGAKISLSFARFIISFVIEMIPFLGNLFPSWTMLVIFELVQGEI